MTPDLKGIRERMEKASAGPWWADFTENDGQSDIRCSLGGGHDQIVATTAEASNEQADAEFIAHARSDVPDLVREVERLTAENDALRDERDRWVRETLRLVGLLSRGATAGDDEARNLRVVTLPNGDHLSIDRGLSDRARYRMERAFWLDVLRAPQSAVALSSAPSRDGSPNTTGGSE